MLLSECAPLSIHALPHATQRLAAPSAPPAPPLGRPHRRGFSVNAHHLQAVNAAARQAVEAGGFEVFDGFGLTLHAPPQWFDDARYGVRYKIHEAEVVSDMTVQALLNQLCG